MSNYEKAILAITHNEETITRIMEHQFEKMGIKNNKGEHLKINEFEIKPRKLESPYIQFKTQELEQAHPMFKSLIIDDFGGCIKCDDEGIITFSIRAHYSHVLFGGGRNGFDCFDIYGTIDLQGVPNITIHNVANES